MTLLKINVPSCQINVPPCQINDPSTQINVPLSNKFREFLRQNHDPRDIYLLEGNIFVSLFDHVYGPLRLMVAKIFAQYCIFILRPYFPSFLITCLKYLLTRHTYARKHYSIRPIGRTTPVKPKGPFEHVTVKYIFGPGRARGCKVSKLESVKSAFFLPNWKVSESDSLRKVIVRIGKCQNRKVSESESVRMIKCHN